MKSKSLYAFWGLVLILAGAASLLGFEFQQLAEPAKVAFFAIASVAFFATYYIDGIKKWGWLFPALIFAALALIVGMDMVLAESGELDAPLILAAVAAPFFVGYALDRKQWQLLIPANILLAMMLFVAIESNISGEMAVVLALYACAVPFLGLFLLNRSRRAALAVAAILAIGATVTLIGSRTYLGATLTLTGSGTSLGSNEKGIAFFLLFAAPFAVVALISKRNWWAVIPAGTSGSLALVLALETFVPHAAYTLTFGIYIWVFFLGMAVTFALVWLRDRAQNWAIYPTVGLAALAVLAYVQGVHFSDYWVPTTLLITGSVIMLGIVGKLILEARHPTLQGHA